MSKCKNVIFDGVTKADLATALAGGVGAADIDNTVQDLAIIDGKLVQTLEDGTTKEIGIFESITEAEAQVDYKAVIASLQAATDAIIISI